MKRKIPLVVFAFLAVFLCVQAAWAEDQSIESLKNEIQNLSNRVQELEQEQKDSDLASRVDEFINYNALSQGEISECGFLSPKGFDLNFGGFFKVDAAYDSHRTNNGNFAWWVNGPTSFGDKRDDEFNLTARQTRIWLNVGGPDTGDIKTSGKVEFDFYGGSTENKNQLLLRHAFLKAIFPGDWELLAGQTSDIMSPLCPRTVNYTVQWNQGNPGYRRPQIRVTKKTPFMKGTVATTVGIMRTIGQNFGGTGDDGADSGYPTVAALVDFTAPCPFFDNRKATIQFSGHWGAEEIDAAMPVRKYDVSSWSLNVGGVLPVMDCISVKGEWFTGENLDTYLAGIGQGLVMGMNGKYRELSSKGGWINVLITPKDLKGWTFTVGYGIDKPHGTIVPSRCRNVVYFGNFFYTITEALKVGFEVSNLATTYSAGRRQDTRVQGTIIYYF